MPKPSAMSFRETSAWTWSRPCQFAWWVSLLSGKVIIWICLGKDSKEVKFSSWQAGRDEGHDRLYFPSSVSGWGRVWELEMQCMLRYKIPQDCVQSLSLRADQHWHWHSFSGADGAQQVFQGCDTRVRQGSTCTSGMEWTCLWGLQGWHGCCRISWLLNHGDQGWEGIFLNPSACQQWYQWYYP